MNYKIILCTSVLFTSLYSIAQGSKNLVEIKGVSQLESEVLQSGKPAIIKVSATWCTPCTRAKKPYELLASDPANADVIFAEVDADASPDVVQKFNVQGLPTFIFIKNGQEVKRSSGFSDNFKSQMTNEIASLRGDAAPVAQPMTEKKTKNGQPAEQAQTMGQPEAAGQIRTPEQQEMKASIAEEPTTCAANPPENFLEKAYTMIADFFKSIADTVSGWFK
jgi:thioredoxin